MNGTPNVSQKRWQNWQRQKGCVMTGAPHPTIDHLKGAKKKLKGVEGLAGEWMTIPLSAHLHTDDNNPESIKARGRKGFEKYHGVSFKQMWIECISAYEKDRGHKPMSDDEYEIIVKRGFEL